VNADTSPSGPGLLTGEEHALLDQLRDCWNSFVSVVNAGGDPAAAASDLDGIADHIHALQAAVLAQAAGRAYPDRYRKLGGRQPTGSG
jgi:hypothetical protein